MRSAGGGAPLLLAAPGGLHHLHWGESGLWAMLVDSLLCVTKRCWTHCTILPYPGQSCNISLPCQPSTTYSCKQTGGPGLREPRKQAHGGMLAAPGSACNILVRSLLRTCLRLPGSGTAHPRLTCQSFVCRSGAGASGTGSRPLVCCTSHATAHPRSPGCLAQVWCAAVCHCTSSRCTAL